MVQLAVVQAVPGKSASRGFYPFSYSGFPMDAELTRFTGAHTRRASLENPGIDTV
jgi:hypothetical protein